MYTITNIQITRESALVYLFTPFSNVHVINCEAMLTLQILLHQNKNKTFPVACTI